MIFYTSDQHFGHERIIKICERPFNSLEEMEEEIIKKWNNKVSNMDTVYVIGDFGYKTQKSHLLKIFERLNGKKHLIIGNHDNSCDATTLPWESVSYYKDIPDQGRRVIMFHYPIEEWDGYYKNSYHLFGHIHNSKNYYRKLDRRFNVGVDVQDFEPKTLDELIKGK